MNKTILDNGITLITQKKDSDSVAIVVSVNVGSNYEPENLLGISHFLEHMIFEGTKKRSNATIISNEIESLGGELNAYTTNERTAFFIRALSKHFDIALDIMADMLQNSVFNTKAIEKERNVILKEINMVTDEPRFHQWILFLKALFKKHPARNPTYGTIKTVKSLSREDLLNYYNMHYKSDSIIISIVGNIGDIKEKIESKFSKFKRADASFLSPISPIIEPKQNSPEIKVEKRNILNAYMVFGYKTPVRESHDSYVLDVIKAILARGQSGKIIEKIRNEKGLAYEVNLHHDSNKGFGTFAVYLNSDKDKIPKIKAMIIKEFENLKNITVEDIKNAKGFIEGHYLLENEDNFKVADKLAFWEHIKSANLHNKYIDTIRKVTKQDIIKVVKEYINGDYTMVVIE